MILLYLILTNLNIALMFDKTDIPSGRRALQGVQSFRHTLDVVTGTNPDDPDTTKDQPREP